MSKTLGILGVGHLASYVVTGLRNAGDSQAVVDQCSKIVLLIRRPNKRLVECQTACNFDPIGLNISYL